MTAPCVFRNLANLVLAAAKGQPKALGNSGGTNATELNLVGDREFLTKESAREALAPLLAPDSAITKVTGAPRTHRQPILASEMHGCSLCLALQLLHLAFAVLPSYTAFHA